MSKQTASLSKVNEKGNHTLAKKRKLSGPGVSKSSQSPVHSILHLQRTKGNQEVQRLLKSGTLQAKLKIGQPNDKYEQEADRVADKVMSMPEPGVQRQPEEEKEEIQTKPLAGQITPLVQRQVDEEEEPVQKKLLQRQETGEEEEIQTKLQRQAEEEEEPVQAKLLQRQEAEEEEEPVQTELQRQAEEEEEPVQTKQSSNQTPAGTSNIESSVNSLKGGGQPISESNRTFFEPRFGTDFSQVRVYTDNKADEAAKSINAKAFTKGKDVVFGSGQYSPGTSSGKRLLAHELTHVVQQGNSSGIKKDSYASRKTPALFLQSSGIVLQRKRKTDPQKVKYADKQFKANHPELKGRRLTRSKADAPLRKEWWTYYRWGKSTDTTIEKIDEALWMRKFAEGFFIGVAQEIKRLPLVLIEIVKILKSLLNVWGVYKQLSRILSNDEIQKLIEDLFSMSIESIVNKLKEISLNDIEKCLDFIVKSAIKHPEVVGKFIGRFIAFKSIKKFLLKGKKVLCIILSVARIKVIIDRNIEKGKEYVKMKLKDLFSEKILEVIDDAFSVDSTINSIKEAIREYEKGKKKPVKNVP